jgi:hypothetical protein
VPLAEAPPELPTPPPESIQSSPSGDVVTFAIDPDGELFWWDASYDDMSAAGWIPLQLIVEALWETWAQPWLQSQIE